MVLLVCRRYPHQCKKHSASAVQLENSDPTELLNWRTRKEVCAVIQILWAQSIEHLNVHKQIVGAYMQIKHVCRWHR